MARRPGIPDPRPHPPRPGATPVEVRPDVIVDFQVEDGLLFVVLKNIGAASAYGVVTRFDHPFHGLGGRKDIAELALFRSLAFVPPGKAFVQLVDHVGAYFARQEPRRLEATVTYADRDGRTYTDVMPHDLDIYRDLADAGRLP
jgi:hypothetical protein